MKFSIFFGMPFRILATLIRELRHAWFDNECGVYLNLLGVDAGVQGDVARHQQRTLGVIQLLQIRAVLQGLLDHLHATVAPFRTG